MRLLLVDDDSDIRRLGKLCLSKIHGYNVLEASEARQGIELARSSRPDVILMDRMMPGMDGLECLKVLRSDPELCNIPVIFLTASANEGDEDDYKAAGAVGVIQKPFPPSRLAAQVESLLQAERLDE